jgi:hypothetical protein
VRGFVEPNAGVERANTEIEISSRTASCHSRQPTQVPSISGSVPPRAALACGSTVLAAAQALRLEAPSGPIDVHVTGTDAGLIAYLGPLAILGAAYLAYRFATKNVRREIAAAEKRQERQLQHDREMQAIAGSRAALDDVTEVLISAINGITDFASNLLATEMTRRKMEAAPEGSEQRAAYEAKWHEMASTTTAEMSIAVTQLNALQPALLRLRLRFPEEDPIYAKYRNAAGVLDAIYDLEREKEVTDLRTDEELKASSDARSQLPGFLADWVQAVRAWNTSLLEPNASDPGT